MKIIFMGSPSFALPALSALYNNKFTNISAVYSQPSKPGGRGMSLQDTEIATFAKEHQLPLFTPITLRNNQEFNNITAFSPDLIVVAAYGLILPKEVLKIPKFGAINIHASILPKWRGASPIHHAIFKGDKYTANTIMYMDEGLDTGDIITVGEKINIDENITFKTLHDLLAIQGGELINKVINRLLNEGFLSKIPQNSEYASFAPKINKQMLKINFAQSPNLVIRQINAFSSQGAYVQLNNDFIKIFSAEIINSETNNIKAGTIINEKFEISTLNGIIKPLKLQYPGRNIISIKDFLNSNKSKLTNININ